MKNAMQLKAIMKKLAKENQISAQLVLQNYMLERFLERVSLSPYRDNYIIKGGFLISSMVGLNSRATMDMDATIKGYPVTQDTVQKMIEKMPTFSLRDRFAYRKWTSKFHLVCFTIFCRGCSLYVAECLAKVAGRRKAKNAGNLGWRKVGFGQ